MNRIPLCPDSNHHRTRASPLRLLDLQPGRHAVLQFGDCYDNAMAESFFATLECELIERDTFATKSEVRLSVFEFIEG